MENGPGKADTPDIWVNYVFTVDRVCQVTILSPSGSRNPFPQKEGAYGMERKRRLAATLTATAIMTVIGAGGAAAAQTQPEDGTADLLEHAQSKLDSPNPDRPKKGCVDVDSVGNEASHAKYVAAVCKGKVYALTVNENSDPGTPVGGWQAVGGPSNVVDVTLASNVFDVAAGPVFITVLTSTGTVWEGRCANNVPLGPCTFYQLPVPPQ
ncbi:hypothetical protein AB0D12_20115 [Streptomyces sp. NPDC048479]|uniref:hypothetical protein n=1 Tax=Streptomyces sp. NPDC048479 TaxID=3154725 RepID=UPI003448A1D0